MALPPKKVTCSPLPDESILSAPPGPALFVRLPNWVGDVCMSLPSLDILLATERPVIVCARSWARGFLSAYPLAGFVDMDRSWRRNSHRLKKARTELGHPSPLGLLLPDSLSSALSFRFAGIASAGYRDDARSLLLRWPLRKPVRNIHAVQSWYQLTQQALTHWQLPAGSPQPHAELSWKAANEHGLDAAQALQRAGLAAGHFVLIAPTAVGQHQGKIKVWRHFDGLTQALQAQGHTVVMAPPENEQAAARQAAPTAQLLPALSLGGFAVLTRLAALVVCNDSGVSHLAAAAGARQVTLFGVTDPARTGPWSNQALRLGSAQNWPTLDEVVRTVLAMLAPSQGLPDGDVHSPPGS